MKEKKIRPKYTKEFKEDAVKLVTTHRRLGIHASNVSRWVREYQRDQEEMGKSGKTHRELEAENRELTKENQRLQMEREILKKAAACVL